MIDAADIEFAKKLTAEVDQRYMLESQMFCRDRSLPADEQRGKMLALLEVKDMITHLLREMYEQPQST